MNMCYGNASDYYPELELAYPGKINLEDMMTAINYFPATRSYYYSPYGEIWQGENEYDTNPFRYSGEYYDKETGSIYLRARYYSPSVGRFLTIDPVKDGTNWYVYCSNNPIAFVDPWGLRDEELSILAEACGGTYTYYSDTQCAIIVVGNKTLTYLASSDSSYVKDGKLYVDGETFAKDLGATYTEIDTEAYEGFIFSYDNDDYYSDSISLFVKETIQGESFANDCNTKQNGEASATLTILGGAVSLYVGAINMVAGIVSSVATTIGGTGVSFVNLSYNLQIGERITATYSVNCSSEYEQAYGLEQITIINTAGEVRVDKQILHK